MYFRVSEISSILFLEWAFENNFFFPIFDFFWWKPPFSDAHNSVTKRDIENLFSSKNQEGSAAYITQVKKCYIFKKENNKNQPNFWPFVAQKAFELILRPLHIIWQQ